MKVLNLRCIGGHGFEGWFASEDDYASQVARGLMACPMCGDTTLTRLPSAPRLNLSGAQPPVEPQVRAVAPTPAINDVTNSAHANQVVQQMQALWMQTVREVMKRTEDVGERFPEEARKIHYGEVEPRGIRGQATPEQRAELTEEGIAVMSLPVPDALKGPAH
jgi:hypothetical protein